MSQTPEDNSSAEPVQSDSEVVMLLKRMQQQLVFLEKKIDTLISQSSEKSFKGNQFPKPFRRFGHSHHHGEGKRDHGTGERSFGQRRPFDKPHGDAPRGFEHRKRTFPHRRKEHD